MNLNSEVPNTGTYKIHATSVAGVRVVEEYNGLDFNVAPGAGSYYGSTLKAAESCEFEVRFTPSSNGVKRANILVDSAATQGPNPIEVVSSSCVVHFDGFELNPCN